ncbi:cytochrome P450 [Fodinicola feengrottensis]|uniref:Cytochrome P450 n=1 Tax=Fodinicola feengrottensis TaxID=435914 RepID=A0ABN2IQZ3_9ACTN|nr:cytochrome P450 [Fodinicola feengrottensis]
MSTHLGAEFDETIAHGPDPYEFYARARVEQPVFYSHRFDLWFITRHDHVVRVLLDPTGFSSEDRSIKPKRWPPRVAAVMASKRHAKHLGNTDPPAHTRLRQVLNQAFLPTVVAGYAPLIREVADDLLDRLAGPEVDLLNEYCYPLPLIVILRVIGVPLDDLDRCMRWCRDKSTLDFAAETLNEDEQLRAAESSVAFVDYCDNLVRQRQHAPLDDLISRLLKTRVKGHPPLSGPEVADLLPLLIFAGHETTANLLGNLLWQLLSTGHWDRLVTDPDLLEAAVEEGLRYDTPALGFVRRALQDTTIAHVRIPAGSRVFLLFGSANRDPARWSEPERFGFPRDRASGHLALGQGIHFCVGAPLARLETRIGLDRLLRRQPTLRLTDPVTEPERRVHLVLRTLRRLPAHWDQKLSRLNGGGAA